MGRRSRGRHRAVAIEWPTKRIDDAPQQTLADNHIHDPAGALDFIASVQMPIFAEQHDADFRLIDVEGHAEQIAGKFHQLLKAHAGEPGHLGDAGGDAGDRTHLSRCQLRRESLPRLTDIGKRLVKDTLQVFRLGAHGCFASGLASSGLASIFGAGFGSGLGAAFASGLCCSFRSSPTPFSRDAR